ncbi:MAG: putative quinol monooxygenase [Anaerolineae bacterium]
MHIIRVLLTVKPEEKEAFITHLNQEAAAVKQNFSGCEKFGLFIDATDENGFLLYEEWESQQHFNAYRESDLFKQNGAKLFPMMAGKPDSAYFSAELAM